MNMKKLKGIVAATSLMMAAVYSAPSLAHGVSETMDPQGTNAGFIALARVTCFDDGNGPTAYLMARVRDKSPSVAGLRVSVHLLKGTRAAIATDSVPGDANYSDWALLSGGNGVYQMMLTKTAAGARAFDLEWHCMTATNVHTGTDILVDQYD
jgi:hypothetical protein